MRYWRIANSDGKIWLLPRRNTRVALALYQPSGWKGKALKMLLPLLSFLPETFAPFAVQEWEVYDSIREILEQIFKGRKLEWAVFEGTPSVHQKLVLQVFCGQEILAYCKISAKTDIISLFTQEAELLQELGLKGIESIPRCLYVGPTGNENEQMLVLSTEKTTASEVPHEWNDLQQSFMEDLQTKTIRMIPFEECDLACAIEILRDRVDVLPECVDKTNWESALNYVKNRCRGKMMNCAVGHGDFTPWNMFVEHGRLFVFDWEYAYRCCPVGMDRYHFLVQTAFFERHWSAEQLMALASTQDGAWIEIDHLIYYLILVLSRFVGREPADKKMSDTSLIAFWNQLIILCLKTK